MTYLKNKASAAVAMTALLSASPAFAGGPLAVCDSGQAFLYPNGGANIQFNPDQGDLGPVANADAVAAVQAAFDVWGSIPSSTLGYVNGGALPVDVDITNFDPYLNAVAPDGLSAVVFDDDGQIFDLLFGPGSGVLGFAGPEWGDVTTCEISESLSFLNGPSFTNATAAFDVMVHEFGHWTNFAHTVVNGQVFIGAGDTTGPNPNNSFGLPPDPFVEDIVETMYPFYFGPGIGTGSLEADDIAIASRMYPAANYASTTGEISGVITFGGDRITGVNVIARNFADPFNDAVSAISSDFTDSTSQADPNVGAYRITGLTPGANYGVYVDEVLAGGFSTLLSSPLPGPEDGYNGQNESDDGSIDDPSVLTPVLATAGAPTTGIDIQFNRPQPGDPLAVGDDGAVQLPLPFEFCLHGQAFGAVYVNANGNLTFGAPDSDFSESATEFLDGPPRIAGVWDDLNPSAGGTVFFDQSRHSFSVTWDNVPEYFATGANSFKITLNDNSNQCTAGHGDDDSSDDDSDDDRRGGPDVVIDYYSLTAADGLAGVTGGLAVTGGAETEADLSRLSRNGRRNIKVDKSAAVFEVFADADNDLAGLRLRFDKVGRPFKDRFERNDSLRKASSVSTPFETSDTRRRYTAIDPPAGDIDFFRFHASAGQTLIAQVTRGQIDSVLGLYYCPPTALPGDDDSSDDDSSDDDSSEGNAKPRLERCNADTAIFLGFNDDLGFGSNPLLSGFLFDVPIDGTWAVGVTFCCDYDFDGIDPGQGAPFDGGRYVLDLEIIDGTLLLLGDDDTIELPLWFDFPFNGASYGTAWVNSNGNLSFGAGDTEWSESVGGLLGGPPRIAPLWDDLSPNQGGFVFYKNEPSSFQLTFKDVPEFFSGNSNNFVVTINEDGSVDIDYGGLDSADGIVGVSEGGGAADPGPTDLSAAPNQSATGTTYEEFDFFNENDLDDANLSFD